MSLTHEIQREYVTAVTCGYGFTSHYDGRLHTYSHYMFRENQMDPGVLADMRRDYGDAVGYIWSFKNCTMASYDGKQPVKVTPLKGDAIAEWTKLCPIF